MNVKKDLYFIDLFAKREITQSAINEFPSVPPPILYL
jgi:hypothetical protein